jgi:hypothetical protein
MGRIFLMDIIGDINSIREELANLVTSDGAILHCGEILSKSQQLDEIISVYYKELKGTGDDPVN